MEVDSTVINYICNTIYNILPIEQSIKQLWGYDDRNYLLVDSSDHQTYILKIINKTDSKPELTDIVDEILDSAHTYFLDQGGEFLVPRLVPTTANKLSTLVDINLKNAVSGDLERRPCNVKLFEYFDGTTVYDYARSQKSSLASLSGTYFHIGRLCSHLFEFLHTQNHLIDQLRKLRQGFSWQLATSEPFIRDQLELFSASGHFDDRKRSLIKHVLDEYLSIESRLSALPQFVVHSDLSTRNILIDKKSRKPTCLVDFGDVQVGNQLTDLSSAMLYGVLEQEADFEQALEKIPAQILRGYRSVRKSSSTKLADEHLDVVLTLMKLRLCQSLTNAQLASERDPGNSCAVTTLKSGWTLLEILVKDKKYSSREGMADLWLRMSSD